MRFRIDNVNFYALVKQILSSETLHCLTIFVGHEMCKMKSFVKLLLLEFQLIMTLYKTD